MSTLDATKSVRRRDLPEGPAFELAAKQQHGVRIALHHPHHGSTVGGYPASTSRSLSPQWCNGIGQFLGDVLAFAGSMAIGGLAAYWIETDLLATPYLAFRGPYIVEQLVCLGCTMLGLCGWFARTGHYTARRPFQEDLGNIWNAVLVGVLISGFVEFANKTNFSRLWMLLTWFLAALTVPLMRVLVRKALAAAGTWMINAVMIGSGRHAQAVKELLSADAYLGYRVTSDGGLAAYTKGADASPGTLEKLLVATNAQTVIVVPTDEEMPDLEAMIDALNVRMIPYVVVPPLSKLPLTRLSAQSFLSCDAVLLRVQCGLLSPFSRAVKRVFDLVVSLLSLGLLMPLFALVSLLVSLDGGPITYAHERIGRGGRAFKCLKFRTMVPNAAEVLDTLLANDPTAQDEWLRARKLRDDPRITKFGKLLRVTSIDELPQLYNVFRGDMSLVGPRPVVQRELCDHYKDDNSYYVLVRPGLTGLWQISGRNSTSYEQRVHLDSWYVRNWSLWGDLIILFRTFPVVILGRGAY
jgi:Undecaprenyl-phosphate galactose phosphotransferase WbaP